MNSHPPEVEEFFALNELNLCGAIMLTEHINCSMRWDCGFSVLLAGAALPRAPSRSSVSVFAVPGSCEVVIGFRMEGVLVTFLLVGKGCMVVAGPVCIVDATYYCRTSIISSFSAVPLLTGRVLRLFLY
jgi:hypothetical protein